MVLGLFGKSKPPDPHALTRPDGVPLPGYLNGTAGADKPAVIVVHDWFGLTPHVRAVVDKFAAAGFVAFAVDLYRGKVARTDDEAQALNAALPWARTDLDVKLAAASLRLRNPAGKVAVVGFAMGGAVAVHAAETDPELAAAVTFYGIPKTGNLATIQGKVLGHFGNKDPRCYPARVNEFEKALLAAKGDRSGCQILRYDAGNGFFNETKKTHSPESAAQAWTRTVEFLRAALGAAPAVAAKR